MERFEFEFLKSLIESEQKANYNYDNVSSIFDDIRSRFGFGLFDMYEIFFKCPELCLANKNAVKKNLDGLDKICSLSSHQMRYLVLKFPFVILVNHVLAEYKVKLLSTLFADSRTDVIDKVVICPNLLFLSKMQIFEKIKMLSEVFDEFGEGVRRLISSHPYLLFISKKQIKEIERVLIYDFTLSEKECAIVFKNCPELLLLQQSDLKKIFNYFYPAYFVKRDMKELFVACPRLMILSPAIFEFKINQIQAVLDATKDETLFFVRNCPNILFFENPFEKINGYKKLRINMEFLKIHPKICLKQEITIPLKFIFARILGLESEFEQLCNVDTKALISRFLFMQSHNLYSHEDLLLPEKDFFKKYSISTSVLQVCYPVKDNDVKQICNYYLGLSNSLPNWADIVFPEIQDLVKFVKGKYKTKYLFPSFGFAREKLRISKKQFDLICLLRKLHLGFDECLYLIRICPMLANASPKNVLTTINYLRKQGFSFEESVDLLLRKPTLFTYFIGDFEQVFEGTKRFYKCSAKQAVELIC